MTLTVDLSVTPQTPKSNSVVIQGNNSNPASESFKRVRNWSIAKYKVGEILTGLSVAVLWSQSITIDLVSPQCTRQALAEKLGRGSRTVDLDLEPRLELLKDDRQRYEHMTRLAQTLANQLSELTVTQTNLGNAFTELSVKTPALHVCLGSIDLLAMLTGLELEQLLYFQ